MKLSNRELENGRGGKMKLQDFLLAILAQVSANILTEVLKSLLQKKPRPNGKHFKE